MNGAQPLNVIQTRQTCFYECRIIWRNLLSIWNQWRDVDFGDVHMLISLSH